MVASRGSRGRRWAALLAGVAASLVLTGAWVPVVPVAVAEPVALFHDVSVRVGSSGEIVGVTRSSVASDETGAPVNEMVEIAPVDAVDQLPVRIQTAWWADGRTGTDLSVLEGLSGRIVIQVVVENLTGEAAEVSYEADGSRYARQVLVAVPLTVSASTTLSEDAGASVVTAGGVPADGEQDVATDGVVSVGEDGAASVQWARLLAPPVLSPTASFTLVVDAEDFVPPEFDIVVQPGVVTDPSVAGLMERVLGQDSGSAVVESSTVTLVAGVDAQVSEALEFIDGVHEALQGDVSQLSEATVAELQASSQLVVDQLESTQSELTSILESTRSELDGASSQTEMEVTVLLDALGTLLGSTVVPPETVGAEVDGCAVVFPQLAEDEPATVASSVYLIDAQLQALMASFADQSVADPELFEDEQAAATPNCRSVLAGMITASIGDSAALATPDGQLACEEAPASQRTVMCGLHVAETSVVSEFQVMTGTVRNTITTWNDSLGVNQVMSALGGLTGALTALEGLAGEADDTLETTVNSLHLWVSETTGAINTVKANVQTASAALGDITTGVGEIRSAYADVLSPPGADPAPIPPVVSLPTVPGALTSDEGVDPLFEAIDARSTSAETVGEWFATSGLAGAVDALIAEANSATPGVCADGWAATLSDSSPAGDIAGALDGIAASPGCPVGPLALAVSDLVGGYQDQAEDAEDTYADVETIHGYVDDLEDYADDMGDYVTAADTYATAVATEMSELDAEITELENLLSGSGAVLPGVLATLYQADPLNPSDPLLGTGLLVDLQAKVNRIGALVAPAGVTVDGVPVDAGDLAEVAGLIDQVSGLATSIWPDDDLLPFTSASQCPEEATEASVPVAAGEAVVVLANQLYCANARLETALADVDQDITEASLRASETVRVVSDQADGVVSDTTARIGEVSDQLVSAFALQRNAAVTGTLSAIDEARTASEGNVETLLEEYQLRNNEVITSLTDAMTAAAGDSEAARQSLAEDFATLIANLGGVDASNRSGLIGKLYDISGQVGHTGTVLATTQSSVTSFGASRSAEMRDLSLMSAHFDASQARLSGYHPFADQGDEAVTVFTFHVGAE